MKTEVKQQPRPAPMASLGPQHIPIPAPFLSAEMTYKNTHLRGTKISLSRCVAHPGVPGQLQSRLGPVERGIGAGGTPQPAGPLGRAGLGPSLPPPPEIAVIEHLLAVGVEGPVVAFTCGQREGAARSPPLPHRWGGRRGRHLPAGPPSPSPYPGRPRPAGPS